MPGTRDRVTNETEKIGAHSIFRAYILVAGIKGLTNK